MSQVTQVYFKDIMNYGSAIEAADNRIICNNCGREFEAESPLEDICPNCEKDMAKDFEGEEVSEEL